MRGYETHGTSDEIRDEAARSEDFVGKSWALFVIGIALLLILRTI